MRILARTIHAVRRALRRPAAGPPETIEPAAAGTASGFIGEALLRAVRTISRHLRHAKADRARSDARLRAVLDAVVARQRECRRS